VAKECGKKLGMTQVFDPDTGTVTFGHGDRGRALSRGPGEDERGRRLRGRAARVRRGARAQADAAGARPLKALRRRRAPQVVEFRGPIDGGVMGESVTVEVFPAR